MRRLNSGVDGFNRWSFVNRGDLDGQWQFIETWDRKGKRLLTQYTPHPNTYFVLGLLSRFTAKHSEVLGCKVDGGRDGSWRRVFAAALRSPRGNVTLALVNDAKTAYDVSVDLRGLANEVVLRRYSIDESQRDRTDLAIDPQTECRLSPTASSFKDRLPAMSLVLYSTYRLAHSDDGIVAE